jgi:hypothetical protein
MRSLLARQLKLQGSWKRFSMINFSTFQFLVVWTPSLKAQWVLEKGFGLGGPRVHVLRTRPTASMVWNQIWSPKVLLIFPADSAVSAEKELCRENPRLACNVPCTANRYLNWTYFELMSTNLRASSGLTNCWPKHFLLSDISLICAHCQVDVILSVINSEMRSISVVKIQSSGVWLYIIIYNITILYNRTIIYIYVYYIYSASNSFVRLEQSCCPGLCGVTLIRSWALRLSEGRKMLIRAVLNNSVVIFGSCFSLTMAEPKSWPAYFCQGMMGHETGHEKFRRPSAWTHWAGRNTAMF